jgi:hypothetical protein
VRDNSDDIVGGGNSNAGGTLSLNNTTVHNNSASTGGGIYNERGTLTLNSSTVKNNSASSGGGGIENYCGGGSGFRMSVTLTASTVNNNSGGGIFNYAASGCTATFTLINSTVSGNSGIGIYNSGVDAGSGLLILKNSTLSGNSAEQGFGAGTIQNISLFGGSATVEIANTILNAGPGGTIGSTGTVISHGYNISSDAAGGDGSTGPGGFLNGPGDIRNTNPQIGPLQNNGGPTMTHALLVNSPAINTGDPNLNPQAFNPPLLYDQRNSRRFPRVVNGRIDIGAFEARNH